MPKGFHLGHTQTRHYTTEYNKLYAKAFKTLLSQPLGNYLITSQNKSTPITLKQTKNGLRYIALNHQDKTLEIGLVTCNKSASNKLYITCPYCQTKRQHLYQCKSGYACKSCLNLHYASQSERKQDRLARRIRKLRRSIWGSHANINNLTECAFYLSKPKNKHWEKFNYDKAILLSLENKYWLMADEQINRLLYR